MALITELRDKRTTAGLTPGRTPSPGTSPPPQHPRLGSHQQPLPDPARAGHPTVHQAPKASYQRFQAELPNQCWQADFTHYPLAGLHGTRCARAGLPVVVIGAGPVGLATAAHLLDRGLEPLVLEAGPRVGANFAQWRHVRLFSPWCLALDPVSVRLLDQSGWAGPDPNALPTGADLLERYLEPLAVLPALASRIRLHTTVVAVARQNLDKGPQPRPPPTPLSGPSPRSGWAAG